MTIHGLLAKLERHIMPAAPALRPAALRLATGLYTAHYLGRRVKMLGRIHRGDTSMFAPVGPCRILKKPLPPKVADALVWAEIAANAAYTLGWQHKVTGPLHAGLLTWTLSYRNSWSMVFHNDNNLVLHTAVLGAAPAADALSLDALRRSGTLLPQRHDWRYGLPATVMSAVTTATYLVAGVAKVTGPMGWNWASGEGLRSQVAADGLRKELLGSRAAGLGMRLYPHKGIYTALAVGSLVIELAAPLALANRRLGQVFAVAAFGMHWGIQAVMGIRFRYNQSGVMYLSFFPLGRALRGY
ncbi:hypothetical protein D477_019853 [Arthrobacter crystallopoietes BAB-32]|uniref:HTTM domain-containing protein n=1 Tax=Arthrobacter crystallopoietes BAB-32 TaxID=1246476 RepID=N1V2L9_9MICC|nr:hypothetical protein [Arthrobacter crystallopoietes]EMY32503.1 hypothetical protein D477_019853 [Arthrobacter crystallopoietes BAB-32]